MSHPSIDGNQDYVLLQEVERNKQQWFLPLWKWQAFVTCALFARPFDVMKQNRFSCRSNWRSALLSFSENSPLVHSKIIALLFTNGSCVCGTVLLNCRIMKVLFVSRRQPSLHFHSSIGKIFKSLTVIPASMAAFLWHAGKQKQERESLRSFSLQEPTFQLMIAISFNEL